jgi:tripartite-type tricarboxylate transporter receptor subunit TctC
MIWNVPLRTIAVAWAVAAGAIAAWAVAACAIPAFAQDYPAHQIELVVPFPAGGGADVGARLVAQIAGETLRQSIVIQNKAGATGAIGSEYVARAAPDGYTLLLATGSTHAVLPAYRSDLPYDTVTSFAPATLVAIIPNMLVVNPKKVPVASIAELIDYLKAHPGKVNFASSGPGSSIHFAAELFKLMTGTEMTHVAYRGSAPALNDLLTGSVDLIFDNLPVVWPQVQQGNLRALGVASLQRSPLAPEVPAIAETLPGYEAVSWIGIVAPAGTPSGVVDRISQAFGAAAVRPDIAARFRELGFTPARNTPAEFTQFIRDDRAKWQRVAREAKLSAQ